LKYLPGHQSAGTYRGRNGTPFSVFVGRAHHLWEVDEDRLSIVPSYQNVKFIEVSVYKTSLSKPYNEIHEIRVKLSG
jgi:hypothetical protein